MANSASWMDSTPGMPIATTIFPSITIGTPLSSKGLGRALKVVGRHRLADGDVDAGMLRVVDLGGGELS